MLHYLWRPTLGGVRFDLLSTPGAEGLQYIHDAVIASMNSGATVQQLMHAISLPPELDLTQEHGKVAWAVKSIWEYYATWFHYDSTTELYAVHARDIYPELAELAGVVFFIIIIGCRLCRCQQMVEYF